MFKGKVQHVGKCSYSGVLNLISPDLLFITILEGLLMMLICPDLFFIFNNFCLSYLNIYSDVFIVFFL